MKKTIIFALFLTILLFNGCQIVEAPEEGTPPSPYTNPIMMKISGGVMEGDTLFVEQNIVVHFSALSNGPAIIQWKWIIYGSVYEGQTIKYIFSAAPPAQTSIKLIGTDNNNVSHERVVAISIKGTIDGLRDVEWVSSTPNGNQFNIVLAFRNRMQYINNKNWNSWEPPTWAPTPIPQNDLSYNIVNGNLVTVPNDSGKYVVIRRTLSPGSYKIAVGKIDNGQAVWGTYDGKTVLEYDVLSNGNVVFSGAEPAEFPGSTGDVGNPVVRWEFLADRALMYINNRSETGTPFIRYITGSDTSAPVTGTTVSGFPKWSMYSIMYSSLQESGLLEWFAGLNVSAPRTPVPFMTESSYFNEDLSRLRTMLVQIGLTGHEKIWRAETVK